MARTRVCRAIWVWGQTEEARALGIDASQVLKTVAARVKGVWVPKISSLALTCGFAAYGFTYLHAAARRARQVPVEWTVTEQRYQAVLEVLQGGLPMTVVAERYGISRQSVHAWIGRQKQGGWRADGLVPDHGRGPGQGCASSAVGIMAGRWPEVAAGPRAGRACLDNRVCRATLLASRVAEATGSCRSSGS